MIKPDEFRVMRVIENLGDPLMEHIEQETGFDHDYARDLVKSMVHSGYVRQKDSDIDHAPAYLTTRRGRDAYQLHAATVVGDTMNEAIDSAMSESDAVADGVDHEGA